jgi:hypothetical protein
MAAVDLCYICTHSGKKMDRRKVNPDKALIRHEFLEVMVRIAKDKLRGKPGKPQITDEMENILKEYIIPFCKDLD